MSSANDVLIGFDDQLFDPRWFDPSAEDAEPWRVRRVVLVEDAARYRAGRFHRIRIAFQLAALRAHAASLERAGWSVQILACDAADGERPWPERLAEALADAQAGRVVGFASEDPTRDQRLGEVAAASGRDCVLAPNPAFLNRRETVSAWIADQQRPAMQAYWPWYRRRSGLLMTATGEPEGGRWSFDSDNRERLPDEVSIPELPALRYPDLVGDVQALVDERFDDHLGCARDLWLPVTRHQSERWLRDFLEHRLDHFGSYQDALSERDPVLFHAVLTPMLNCGLLTPDEVVRRALARHQRRAVPLNALEGFLRQVAGWREFVRAMHAVHGATQAERNHYDHQRGLARCWWTAETGIPPFDAAIGKMRRLGYLHHIERLMVIGNAFLLCEIAPRAAHAWFMEGFVDSERWVMGPNVYGMALRSDGGLMTSKPYCCGSSYLRRMGPWAKGDWCEVVDGLYWRFVDAHRDEFARNPRLAAMVGTLERMDGGRRHRILTKAGAFIARVTT